MYFGTESYHKRQRNDEEVEICDGLMGKFLLGKCKVPKVFADFNFPFIKRKS